MGNVLQEDGQRSDRNHTTWANSEDMNKRQQHKFFKKLYVGADIVGRWVEGSMIYRCPIADGLVFYAMGFDFALYFMQGL